MLFEKDKYRKVGARSFMMIIRALNPFTAFNELVFGRRVPKVVLIEKNDKKAVWERRFYPCPHCHTLHDARIWSFENKTENRNWFGLYCPTCGMVIPCLTSFFVSAFLVVSFPLWIGFRKKLQRKWLNKQPSRFLQITFNKIPAPYGQSRSLQNGIGWGMYMFLFMGVLYPLAQRQPITKHDLTISFICWLVFGMGHGFSTKMFMRRLKRKGKLN